MTYLQRNSVDTFVDGRDTLGANQKLHTKELFMRQWVIAVMALGIAARASAGLLLHEPFNYAPGQVLADQVAPNGHVWATTSANINDDDIVVLAGNLSFPGFPASSGNS